MASHNSYECDVDKLLELFIDFESNRDNIIKILSRETINIEHDDRRNFTLLAKACWQQDKYVFRLLLMHDLNLNLRDNYGETVLIQSARRGCRDITDMILNRDCDVDIQCYKGWNALMHACERGCRNTIRKILKKKPNIFAKNWNGLTALNFAFKNGDIINIHMIQAYIETVKLAKRLNPPTNPFKILGINTDLLPYNSSNNKTNNHNRSSYYSSYHYNQYKNMGKYYLSSSSDDDNDFPSSSSSPSKYPLYVPSTNHNTNNTTQVSNDQKPSTNSVKPHQTSTKSSKTNECVKSENKTISSINSNKLIKFVKDITICPITLEKMKDPVINCVGQTYERYAIENWYKHNDTDPLSGQKIKNKTLTPNNAIKSIIEESRHSN